MDLYNKIGKTYNTTRKADPLITSRICDLLTTNSNINGSFLDIGCGTGNYTIELCHQGLNFTGIDPSQKMIEIAQSKSNEIKWDIGKAEDIGYPNHSFDGAIATLTIHHWDSLEKSFQQIFRVLKPDSSIVIFTSTTEQMEEYWLNYYFPEMMKASSIKMPSYSKIVQAAKHVEFELITIEKYFIHDDLEDLFLYSGKNDPAKYLDENIRRSISSFAEASSQKEIDNGLKQLEQDISNNTIEVIKNKFKYDLGDYMFLVFKKKSID